MNETQRRLNFVNISCFIYLFLLNFPVFVINLNFGIVAQKSLKYNQLIVRLINIWYLSIRK